MLHFFCLILSINWIEKSIRKSMQTQKFGAPFLLHRGTFRLMLKQVLALMTLPRSNSCMTFQTHFLYHQTMRRINPRFQFHKGLFGVAAPAAKSWLGVIWKSIDYQAEEERIYHSNGTLGVSPNPMVCRKRNFQKILLPTCFKIGKRCTVEFITKESW